MKQEDKGLLLKDLCARLPYEVVVAFQVGNNMPDIRIFTGKDYDYLKYYHFIDEFTNCTFKPYLRSMSSMTEEEILDLYKIVYDTWYCDSLYYKNEEWISFRDSIQNNTLCFKSSVWLSDINKVINWLLKNHFDFQGLIPKGLAIEVNKENNPYK